MLYIFYGGSDRKNSLMGVEKVFPNSYKTLYAYSFIGLEQRLPYNEIVVRF